jgi:hypothetical protein
MLILFIAMAVTDTQQAQHDRIELAIYTRIQAEQATIAEIWRPNARLLSDYHKARNCYVKFHLYRASTCDAELGQVDRDLGSIEMARANSR